MKRKQKEEIKLKSVSELLHEVEKRRTELIQLRINILTAKEKNTSLLIRKNDELAFVKTILREKKLMKKNTSGLKEDNK